jgi:hypothetical protein
MSIRNISISICVQFALGNLIQNLLEGIVRLFNFPPVIW